MDGVQKIKPGGSAQAAPKDAPKDSTKDSSMEPNKDSKQDATKSTNMPDPSQALSKSAEKAVK